MAFVLGVSEVKCFWRGTASLTSRVSTRTRPALSPDIMIGKWTVTRTRAHASNMSEVAEDLGQGVQVSSRAISLPSLPS